MKSNAKNFIIKQKNMTSGLTKINFEVTQTIFDIPQQANTVSLYYLNQFIMF